MINSNDIQERQNSEFALKVQYAAHMCFNSAEKYNHLTWIVGLINAPLRTDEFALDQMPQDHFQCLSILLIEGEQEEREHDTDHAQRRRSRTYATFA